MPMSTWRNADEQISPLLWSLTYLVPYLGVLCRALHGTKIKSFCDICYVPTSCEEVVSKTKESEGQCLPAINKGILGSWKIMVGDNRDWQTVTQSDKGQNPSYGSNGLMTQPPATSSDSSQTIPRALWVRSHQPSCGTTHVPLHVLFPLVESLLLTSDLLT